MPRLKHTPFTAIQSLSQKNDVRILGGGIIQVLAHDSSFRTNDLGNGSWGRIDYLVKVAGFRLQRVGSFI